MFPWNDGNYFRDASGMLVTSFRVEFCPEHGGNMLLRNVGNFLQDRILPSGWGRMFFQKSGNHLQGRHIPRMEAVCSTETLVTTHHTIRLHNPENHIIYQSCYVMVGHTCLTVRKCPLRLCCSLTFLSLFYSAAKGN
jgi:hypothetical protein